MRQATAITIGNFDGVHRGHVELVRAARNLVGPSGRVVVLAFDPHPLTALNPQRAPQPLSDFRQRRLWLANAGADLVAPLRPEPQLLSKSPLEFLQWLRQEFQPDFIVEGRDFGFGRHRAGTVQTLRDAESEFRFKAIIIDPVEVSLEDQSVVPASSSLVRWLLERGRVADASRVLGRPHQLVGPVASGEKRGRAIGMPTINLGPVAGLLPADGIYSGVARRPDGSDFPAAISVGTKPTFGEHPRVCEAHLIGYAGPLDDYGWTVTIEFHRWLRDQIKYSSAGALVSQLHRDLQHVIAASRRAENSPRNSNTASAVAMSSAAAN